VAISEIYIFHAQANALHEAKSAAVKEFSHQAIVAFEVREDSPYFAGRQHDGQLGRACDALDVVDEIEFSLKHLLIEKQECGESLVLRRSSDMLFSCEMGKEFGNFAFAHCAWMTFAMKKDVTPNPIHISLLGADRIVFYAQVPPNAVE
jgi:hypothetical protein